LFDPLNLIVASGRDPRVARSLGVMIIHAPSDTMKFYEGTQWRERMISRRFSPISELESGDRLGPGDPNMSGVLVDRP
jgi:hypothetical protein